LQIYISQGSEQTNIVLNCYSVATQLIQ